MYVHAVEALAGEVYVHAIGALACEVSVHAVEALAGRSAGARGTATRGGSAPPVVRAGG